MPYAPDHISMNEPDAFGTYPIQFAMSQDDPDMVKLALESGADPNIDLGQGWTPLHEAVDYAIDGMIQHNLDSLYSIAVEMIKILLDKGADLSKKTNSGKTPLDIINDYAAGKDGFDALINMFKPVIPKIEMQITYNSNIK